MARPKGSKNKTRTVKATVDYAAVVAEKATEKEKIESEVAALTANINDLKTQLKAKKAELKTATKELAKAENKKAAAEAIHPLPRCCMTAFHTQTAYMYCELFPKEVFSPIT